MITASAQVPNWEWSKNVTGKYNEMTTCTAVDSLGNVYAAGTFSSKSIVFDLLLLKKSGQFRE